MTSKTGGRLRAELLQARQAMKPSQAAIQPVEGDLHHLKTPALFRLPAMTRLRARPAMRDCAMM